MANRGHPFPPAGVFEILNHESLQGAPELQGHTLGRYRGLERGGVGRQFPP